MPKHTIIERDPKTEILLSYKLPDGSYQIALDTIENIVGTYVTEWGDGPARPTR